MEDLTWANNFVLYAYNRLWFYIFDKIKTSIK